MTDKTPLPHAAFYELQPLLVAFTHALGGDGDQVYENLNSVVYTEDIGDAILPLLKTSPLTLSIRGQSGKLSPLFLCQVALSAPVGSLGEGVRVVIYLNIPGQNGKAVPVLQFIGYETGPAVLMLGGFIATNVADTSALDIKSFSDAFEALENRMPKASEAILRMSSAALSFFEGRGDLSEDARETHEVLTHIVADLRGDVHNLPLSPSLHLKMPTLLRLVEDVCGYSRDQLVGPFLTFSGRLVQAMESVTLRKIENHLLNKEEFKHMLPLFGKSEAGSVTIAGFKLPIYGDEEPLDHLNIVFSGNQYVLELEGGGFKLEPSGDAQANSFSPQKVKALVTPGEGLSQEQALENRAFLIRSLKAFLPHTNEGKKANKTLKDVLMFLNMPT